METQKLEQEDILQTTCPFCKTETVFKLDAGCLCIKCGYFTVGDDFEEIFNHIKGQIPNIYLDMVKYDEKGVLWMPLILSDKSVGVIFVEGENTEEWHWTVVRVKEEYASDFSGALDSIDDVNMLDYKTTKKFSKNNFSDAFVYLTMKETL